MAKTIAREYGVHYTVDEVAALSFDVKSQWLKSNPVTAARIFVFKRKIADYAIRILFQARGSSHAHCVILV